MLILGDIHGKIYQYLRLIEGTDESFQIGDMGLGFKPLPPLSKGHRFIRGNHDDPALCRAHPNYAGDYGYDPNHKLFFLGGAWSIDQDMRKRYQSDYGETIWWPDEELSDEEMEGAIGLYSEAKPELVITHDCPESISAIVLKELMVGFTSDKLIRTRTGRALERMFNRHQPKLWIFGHYHVDKEMQVAGTNFRCLDELSTFPLP